MAVNKINLPYPDFKLGDVIDPDEFDANNDAIITTVNALVDATNTYVDDNGEDIFLPTYIKETHIEGAEIRSPLITGNTLIGSTGMVGITSVGITSDSIRIWAGSSNRNVAPFRVAHDGSTYMTKATISGDFMTTNSSGTVTTSRLWNEGTVGGRLMLNTNTGELNAVIGDASGADGNIGGTITLHNRDINKKRVALGINTEEDGGIVQVYNTLNNVTGLMYGGSNLGDFGVIMLGNEAGAFGLELRGKGNSYFKNKLAIGGTTIISSCNAQINGNLNVTGDIYINGIKMKLTPA